MIGNESWTNLLPREAKGLGKETLCHARLTCQVKKIRRGGLGSCHLRPRQPPLLAPPHPHPAFHQLSESETTGFPAQP